MSRRLIEEAFRGHGVSDPAKLDSYVDACDLDGPVSEEILPIGTLIDVWVADGKRPGKFSTLPGTQPGDVAISPEGRHLESFRLVEPIRVIRCTAAAFPESRIPGVGGKGGGTQFIMPPNWLMAVEQITHD